MMCGTGDCVVVIQTWSQVFAFLGVIAAVDAQHGGGFHRCFATGTLQGQLFQRRAEGGLHDLQNLTAMAAANGRAVEAGGKFVYAATSGTGDLLAHGFCSLEFPVSRWHCSARFGGNCQGLFGVVTHSAGQRHW